MTETDEVPDHIPPMSEEGIWEKLRLRFSLFCDLVGWMQVETKEQAVGVRTDSLDADGKPIWQDKLPLWFDEELGMEVPAWGYIPYIDAIDQEELAARIAAAARLIPVLEQHFSLQVISLRFLADWGEFSAAAGVVQFVNCLDRNVGHGRSAKAGTDVSSLEDHERWFAHYFLRIYRRGKMDECRDAMERFINAVVKGEAPVPSDERDWFKRFLNGEKQSDLDDDLLPLTGRFRDELSVVEMKRLLVRPTDDLRWLDLDFPYPLAPG